MDGGLPIKFPTITLNTRLTNYLSQWKTNERVGGRDNILFSLFFFLDYKQKLYFISVILFHGNHNKPRLISHLSTFSGVTS